MFPNFLKRKTTKKTSKKLQDKNSRTCERFMLKTLTELATACLTCQCNTSTLFDVFQYFAYYIIVYLKLNIFNSPSIGRKIQASKQTKN